MIAIVLTALLASASATTIFRVPAHDSAVIKTDRVGGSFAYSVAESPAYGVVNPIVQHVTSPVATTYSVQQPITTNTLAHVVPSTSHVVSSPMVSNFVSSPVMSNVAEVKTTMPVTTSGLTYSSYPYNYMYGASSPMYYSIPKNTVYGVETEKKMMEQYVHPVNSHIMTSSPVATTYTSNVVPQYTSNIVPQYTSNIVPQYTSNVVPQYSSVVATGSPSTWSYASGQPTWSNNVNWNPNWNTVNSQSVVAV